ncbi:sensor histidine kinase [Streptomyces calidiresistens]|nr:histidine kinase [Streptomyces calidiresistens]
MSDLECEIRGRMDALTRRGPYVLLGIGLALSVATAPAFGATETIPVLVVGALALAGWHAHCTDRRWGRPLDDLLGRSYLTTRTAVLFLLTWLNPFFAVSAIIGYLDASLYTGRRGQVAVFAVTALLMAGSQSGGLPPREPAQLIAIVGLFGLNFGLVMFFDRFERRQARLAEERDATIRELERANARLAEAVAENEALQSRLIEGAREAGVHAERERLALEIHDTIAQNLAGIVTQLQAAGETADPRAAERRRARAADLAREALDEARHSVQGLLPCRLDHADLPTALDTLVEDWRTTTGTDARLVVDGEPEPLHRDVEATVLRVAQEALTNVAKHADASRVGVTLSYMGEVLTLDVRDDGAGFTGPRNGTPRPAGAGGLGLPGMGQRAARVAGEVVVESEPGAGTAVCLTVPAVRDA